MRFRSLAICLAAIATILLLAYADAPHHSLATSPPSAQRFSIDLDPANFPANTATSLGTIEPCATVVENNVLDYDEDFVDTLEFDVTVIGIPPANAMIGYAYTLTYPAPFTRIVYRQPMLINPPGIPPDPLPDTDGTFNVSMLDTSGTGVSGSGVLDRIRIETVPPVAPGVYLLTLNSAAHIDTNGNSWAPDALDSAMIELNTGGCSLLVDIELLSMSLTSAGNIPIGAYSSVGVDSTIRNNSPYVTQIAAEATFSVPSDCTVNGSGGNVVVNTAGGVLAGGASTIIHQDAVLHCTTLGPHTMPVTACGIMADPANLDVVSANNCQSQNLNFDVVAPPGTDSDADGVWDLDEFNCGVSTFGLSVRPELMNGVDDDGDGLTDEALPTGSETSDCDGDGYTGAIEAHVFQAADRDQQQCGTTNWVADFVSGGVPDSTNRITVTDITSFLAPTRHLNTNVGDNPGNVRWDTMPGKGLFTTDINIADLTSLLVTAPAMFGGNRAYSTIVCQPIGCTASNGCCPNYPAIGIRLCLTSDRLVYHAGEPVTLNLAVTNVSGGSIALHFPDTCLVDTGTYAVASGTTWGTAGLFVCSLIPTTVNLAPGETRNYLPASGPTAATDTYRIVVKLNASECPTGFSGPCYAPACQLLTCLATQQGYAIRRVP